MKFDLYVEQTFLSPQEIVPNPQKTKSLNSLKFRIDTLTTKTEDRKLLSKISSIYLLLEDAYNISMYQFQLKTFIMSLSKEIKAIEDYVESMS